MYLLCDSEPSDQGAVCPQTHQILRWPETKSSEDTVKCLSISICVMEDLYALTFFFFHFSDPTITADIFLSITSLSAEVFI